MKYEFLNYVPMLVFLIIESLIISFICLKSICNSTPDRNNFLYISSGKSATNARLLGGLGLAMSLIVGTFGTMFLFPHLLSSLGKSMLWPCLLSLMLVTTYGYIDDKFEVRVRFKLFLQFAALIAFSFPIILLAYGTFEIFPFFVTLFLGFALVNGSNLIDGLDTLTVKMGIVASIAYAIIGLQSNSVVVIAFSAITCSALVMFYFFNKEPAKVYMGEIGGGIIGLVFFMQTFLCFTNFKASMSTPNALAIALIPGCLPVCELGISFLRRLWFNKSPFSGDRLHLHYILKNEYKLSASKASSLMGGGSALLTFTGLMLAFNFNPLSSFIFVIVSTISIYLFYCLNKWKNAYYSTETKDLVKIFEGKNVNLIDTSDLGMMEFTIEKGTASKKA
jgi:UDP-N-acetylmuramyl pentapeptide phosphotransferase/UDP-N-acetylglucosamine-1-phosphate transferase